MGVQHWYGGPVSSSFYLSLGFGHQEIRDCQHSHFHYYKTWFYYNVLISQSLTVWTTGYAKQQQTFCSMKVTCQSSQMEPWLCLLSTVLGVLTPWFEVLTASLVKKPIMRQPNLYSTGHVSCICIWPVMTCLCIKTNITKHKSPCHPLITDRLYQRL